MASAQALAPIPTSERADELRRVSMYAARLAKVANDYAWHWQRDPNYADLLLADAARWVLPDVDGLTDHISMCLDELRWDEDGYEMDGSGDYRRDWPSRWTPLGSVK